MTRLLRTLILRIFFHELGALGLDNVPRSGRVVLTGRSRNGIVDRWLVGSLLGERRGLTVSFDGAAPDGDATWVPVVFSYPERTGFRSDALAVFGPPLPPEATAASRDAALVDLAAEADAQGRPVDRAMVAGAARLLLAESRGAPALGELLAPHNVLWATERRLVEGYRRAREGHGEEVAETSRRLEAYLVRLQRLGLDPAEVQVEHRLASSAHFALRELELVVFGTWLFLWGAVNHVAPYRLVGLLAKGRHGAGSGGQGDVLGRKLQVSLVVFPAFYGVQTALVGLLAGPVAAAAYLLTLPLFGYYALAFLERSGATLRRLRGFWRLAFRPALQAELREEATAIVHDMQRLAARIDAEGEIHADGASPA